MRETSTKIGTIHIELSHLGQINFFTTGTECLKPRSPQGIRQTDWQNFLSVTQSSRTSAINSTQIFLIDFGKTSGSKNEARVKQSIQIRSFLVKFQKGLFIEIIFIRGTWTQYHPHTSLQLLLGNRILQAMQVKRIADKIFIKFNHKLVAF